MKDALLALLRSRKFLLALFAVIQTLVLHYANVPDEIWQTIAALVGLLITMIAVEDAAEKRGGGQGNVTVNAPQVEVGKDSGGPVS